MLDCGLLTVEDGVTVGEEPEVEDSKSPDGGGTLEDEKSGIPEARKASTLGDRDCI